MKVRQAKKIVRNITTITRWINAAPYWRERISDLMFYSDGTVFGDHRLCKAIYTVRRWLYRTDEPKIKNLRNYGI